MRTMIGRRSGRTVKFIFLTVLVLPIHLRVRAQVDFRARLFTGAAGDPPINARISIESYSSGDELLLLNRHLDVNDIDGFRAAFKQMMKGTLNFPQSSGLFIQLHAAVEHPTEKGVRIFLVTDAQSAIPGAHKLRSWEFRFLVIVLDLDKNFNGHGKIYEDAELRFTEKDITMVSSSSVPKMLTNVRLVK